MLKHAVVFPLTRILNLIPGANFTSKIIDSCVRSASPCHGIHRYWIDVIFDKRNVVVSYLDTPGHESDPRQLSAGHALANQCQSLAHLHRDLRRGLDLHAAGFCQLAPEWKLCSAERHYFHKRSMCSRQVQGRHGSRCLHSVSRLQLLWPRCKTLYMQCRI